MEKKEFEFKGFAMNGFVALFIEFAIIGLSVWSMIEFAMGKFPTPLLFVIGLLVACIWPIGFRKLEPNEAMVMLFFGKYRGTFTKTGFHWVYPTPDLCDGCKGSCCTCGNLHHRESPLVLCLLSRKRH